VNPYSIEHACKLMGIYNNYMALPPELGKLLYELIKVINHILLVTLTKK